MSAETTLTDYYEIGSLRYFRLLIEDLWENYLQKGTLIEVEGTISVKELIQILRTNSALPDIINVTFSTIPGGQKYRLSCDTYHGSGVFEKLSL